MEPVEDSVFMFCYTSGTTGSPKAAMMTHKNMLSGAHSGEVEGICTAGVHDVFISYLPLSHTFEQLMNIYLIYVGASIGYFDGNMLKLTEDMQELKPTLFCTVPRLFNKIYDKINAGVRDNSSLKQFMFNKAMATKLQSLARESVYTNPFWDKLVFNKIRNILGGRVRMMVCGSAPMNSDVLQFLKVAFCCPIREGYGLTETCACATLCRSEDSSSGHIGGVMPSCHIKLRDIPEMNYMSTGDCPRGEICIKGNSVIQG